MRDQLLPYWLEGYGSFLSAVFLCRLKAVSYFWAAYSFFFILSMEGTDPGNLIIMVRTHIFGMPLQKTQLTGISAARCLGTRLNDAQRLETVLRKVRFALQPVPTT